MPVLSKKGDYNTTVMMEWIVILVLAVMLFVFIRNSALLNTDITAKETCKRSVQQYAQLKFPGIDLASTGMIKCPVTKQVIDASNEEAAKRQIANAMYNCFDQFGAGKLELFDTRRGSTDSYCVVCSKVSFTDKSRKLSGLAEYLSETTIPGKDVDYYTFFKGSAASVSEAKTVSFVSAKDTGGNAASGGAAVLDNAPFDVVDTSKDYAVLFTYGKTTGWWDKFAAGGLAGAGGGAVGTYVGVIVGGAIVGIFTGGIGWVATAGIIAGSAAAGGSVGAITAGGYAFAAAPFLESKWQAGVLFVPYDNNIKPGCTEVPIKQ